jgi:hypothetical protein
MPVTFAAIRKMALALDHVEEGTCYGSPAFRTNGALFARLREDLDSLVVRMDFDRRKEMIAADPATYFITDHYLNYKWILVRLSLIHPDAMRDLLRMAHRLASSEKKKPSRPRRRSAAR